MNSPMPRSVAESGSPVAGEYRRRARRLRHQLRQDRGRLLGSLRRLSDEFDGRTGAVQGSTYAPSPAGEEFTRLVSQEASADGLRYSRRLALLQAAGRLGIGRFEANLIIACVEHRLRGTGVAHGPSADRAPRLGWVALGAAALGVQASIVLAAWWAFGG